MIQGEKWKVLIGKNLDLLPTLEDNSVDSIVTDPPYELGFMGKKWDSTGIAYNPDLWRECLRVLKPGGHLLSFGGTRTWHRIAVAIEDAGFEVRDSIAWMYGSGFPKSLDISKAIDKQAGVEREVIGKRFDGGGGGGVGTFDDDNFVWSRELDVTKAATSEAQQWEGWGTALKPAFEPIIVARKPLIGTVAENVLTYGTGGLNIDGSRVNNLTQREKNWTPQRQQANNPIQFGGAKSGDVISMYKENGRWPANVILDEYTAGLLDEQSGERGGGYGKRGNNPNSTSYGFAKGTMETVGYGDSGGASRFFYVAKASKRDRNEGLEELEERQSIGGGGGIGNYLDNVNSASGKYGSEKAPAKNFHPTVKPTELMRYLVKLVTPPNGLVLDPFTGSGSTGKAAILEGFSFLGMEMTEDYIPIIEGRLRHAETQVKENEGLF